MSWARISRERTFRWFLWSFRDIQGKIWNWLGRYIPGEMFCMTFLEKAVITRGRDPQAHRHSCLTMTPGRQAGWQAHSHPSGMWSSDGCLFLFLSGEASTFKCCMSRDISLQLCAPEVRPQPCAYEECERQQGWREEKGGKTHQRERNACFLQVLRFHYQVEMLPKVRGEKPVQAAALLKPRIKLGFIVLHGFIYIFSKHPASSLEGLEVQ